MTLEREPAQCACARTTFPLVDRTNVLSQRSQRRRVMALVSVFPYTLEYRTRWSDNDQYGHMNNAVYYTLIDSIVNTYLLERCSIQSSGSIGLVVSSHCTFNSPLSFPSIVKLGLRVTKIGRTSVTYEVGFFTDHDDGRDAPSAVGGYTHVFVDRESRKPLRSGMGEKLRKGLQALHVQVNPQAKSRL